MVEESRTAKSLKNSQVAIAFYCLNLILTFFSRQVFIRHLGAEVLGLNTTAVNLLGFLNLAELGIGAAVSFSLYKPLAGGDRRAVCDIVSVQGWLYRRIAWFVMGAAAVLACFFPVIFAKATVPLWYAYATFGVLLFSALAGYFFNYRQVVVSADQSEYRLTTVTMSVKIVKVLLQIAAILLLPHGYVWWLAMEFAATIATVAGINSLLRRRYPWLATDAAAGGELHGEYPQIVAKIRQLFFHKIGGFVLTQTGPLVIYTFTSLTTVAVYGNYMFIVTGVSALFNAVLNGVTAGVGNLLVEADGERAARFFGEMSSFRFLLACVCCVAMWLLTPAFIELWVGAEYVLDDVSLGLLVATLYVTITRGTVDTFINASGLYGDIWAPVVEASLNLGLSILGGWLLGLHGILAGVLLSLVIVIKGWKPWFFFSRWLKVPFRRYLAMYGRHAAALAVALAAFVPAIRLFHVDPAVSWLALSLYGAATTAGFGAILGGTLWLFDRGMRDFVARALRIIKS